VERNQYQDLKEVAKKGYARKSLSGHKGEIFAESGRVILATLCGQASQACITVNGGIPVYVSHSELRPENLPALAKRVGIWIPRKTARTPNVVAVADGILAAQQNPRRQERERELVGVGTDLTNTR
jgi:hypothetical protein